MFLFLFVEVEAEVDTGRTADHCGAVLSPYKYAGYPMLIGTIKFETADSQLFSKETPLLPAAAQLAYHTIDCSALNAEELRRCVHVRPRVFVRLLNESCV